MNITIAGAGYVGLTSAAVLNPEHSLTIRDINQEKIESLKAGNIPINEPGMAELLFDKKRKVEFDLLGNLEWLKDTDLLIIAVGTPTLAGSTQADTSAIDQLIAAVAEQNPSLPIIIKSTIPIMYCDAIVEQYGLKVLHVPEFLRQGTAVQDALSQSDWIIGRSVTIASDQATELGNALYSHTPGFKKLHVVPNKLAALAKLARNTFLALHISYANELNELCHATDIDYMALKSLMSLDSRIKPTYMIPSPGFGGSCLPKDTRSLSYQYTQLTSEWLPGNSKQKGILGSIVDNNITTLGCAYTWVRNIIDKYRSGSQLRIGVLGITFKPDTDDLRESRYFDIMKALGNDGDLDASLTEIAGYDESISGNIFDGHPILSTGKTLEEVIQKSDILIVNHGKYASAISDATAKVIIDFSGSVKPEQRRELYSWIS